MERRELVVETGRSPGLVDLTDACAGFLADIDAADGGHGADHVLPLLASPSLTVPVAGGQLELGTWQSIALLDPNRDNPRRTVRLSFIPG